MTVRTWSPLILLALAAIASAAEPPARAGDVDFVRDIQPVFREHCAKCHGFKKRESGLRLDRKELAFLGGESGKKVIVPRDAKASRLVGVLDGSDELHMPKDADPLPPAIVAKIRAWIEAGANWPESADGPEPKPTHWAFANPVRPPMPRVKQELWTPSPIDHFIRARLEREGLTPNPEADRYTLIRRVYLDLIGLPPTPEQVKRFVADNSAGAYEAMVDRALNDPAFGERWARMWLDLARFADSAGYGSDPLRPDMWPWRDWVIKAYNDNMPFDRFTIEQLAGDLLPGATRDQIIATAFHRNTMTNTEGGTDDEEFRVAAVKDRVNTTVQVWMGLTMGCAQCHSHKYDPITQREYYGFYAIFNQTEDADRTDEEPRFPLPTKQQEEQTAKLKGEIAALEQQAKQVEPQVQSELGAWEESTRRSVNWVTLKPKKITAGTFKFEDQDDGSVLVASGGSPTSSYVITATAPLTKITAIRLELLTDPSLPKQGPGRSPTGQLALSEFKLSARSATINGGVTLYAPTASARNSEAAQAIDNNDKTHWALGPGEVGKPYTLVFQTIKPIEAKPDQPIELTATLSQQSPEKTIGRFRLSVTSDAQPVAEIPVPIRAIIDTPAAKRTAKQKSDLLAFYRPLSPTYSPIARQLQTKKLELTAIKPLAIPIMKELPADKRRVTHLLIKGNFLNPGDEVRPALPDVFNPQHLRGPLTRLDVAKWLVSRDNPLTARVQVNRFWAQLFGRGLVETEEDFGTQGATPSHPELLDWLAVEFMDSGWEVKRLLKQMVMSATYRQASRVSPESLAKDPQNRLYSHAPRFRLEAELVRDQALALSGLLSRKMGGPSVYPPQPDGLWRAAFNGQRNWATSTGEDKYRRGLYTFLRRTVPYPSMATFDAPSRELCTIRRVRTNTPLQAFVTLNDPVYVEIAQALGRRLMREGGTTVEQRVRFGLELCLARPASDEQVLPLVDLFNRELDRYRKDADAAKALATEPIGKLPDGLDAAEAAAWTVVANVLLNLDGVLTKG